MLKHIGINERDHKYLKQQDFPDEIALQPQRTWTQADFITLNLKEYCYHITISTNNHVGQF